MSNEPYRRPRSSRASRWIRPTLLLLLLFAIAALWRGPLSGVLWRGLGPLRSGVVAVAQGVGGVMGDFHSKAALQAQNALLQSEVAQLQVQAADRAELAQENAMLKAELGRPGVATGSTVLAGVTAMPPAVPYDTLMIDAGSAQGVALGDIVSAQGVFLGEVSDVSGSSAQVVLFSSPGETHQGYLNGTVPVLVTGDGAGALSAQVPSNTTVSVGDFIAFPGISGGVSETVAGIKAPAGSSFETLELHLPVDIFNLRFVEVLRAHS